MRSFLPHAFAFCGSARLEPRPWRATPTSSSGSRARPTSRRSRRCASRRWASRARSPRCSSRSARWTPKRGPPKAPKIHALREAVSGALAEPQGGARRRGAGARLATETLDLSLPAPEAPQGSVHPVSQVMDELAEIFADLGFAVAEGPGDRGANGTISPRSTCPRATRRGRCTTPSTSSRATDEDEPLVLRTHTSPVQMRAMEARARRSGMIAPGPGLSLRQRRHPHADVPPGRRAGDRPRDPPRPPQVDAGDFPQGVLRARRHRPAPAPELFPVHRAVGRGRRRLVDREGPPRRRRAARAGWRCSAAAWSTPA